MHLGRLALAIMMGERLMDVFAGPTGVRNV